MDKTILVPTDFSKNAFSAAKYALGLARHSDFKLHFIHSFLPLRSAFLSQAVNADEREEARLDAEKSIGEFREIIGDTGEVTTSFSVAKGHLTDCLKQFIRENPVGLIIMGTHGVSGTRKDILGSNTNDVAVSIPIPLIIVPENNTGFRLNKIVFFTDYQENDIQVLRTFQEIGAGANISCTLVHIDEEAGTPENVAHQELEEWKTKLQQESGFEGLRSELVSGDENVYIINRILERMEADLTLLTLIERKKFLDRLLYKSLAKSIILNPTTPVLLHTGMKN